MTGRAERIESIWLFDIRWRLNWRTACVSTFRGEPQKRAWSA